MLETIINKKVINSYDVSRFDSKSELIIKELFRAYYNNIRILPNSTLKRIYRGFIYNANIKNCIDFRTGYISLLRKEIYKICHEELADTEYIIKRKIIARNIADHIAGMTDNNAMSEYKKIYQV
ncbi:hypothetical protein [uncultured Clostridium sp.]|uniref:hypothetical protein n=1 Tax=uncultured Clostridium sp. TaxID=59620 RepID=UPI00345A8271